MEHARTKSLILVLSAILWVGCAADLSEVDTSSGVSEAELSQGPALRPEIPIQQRPTRPGCTPAYAYFVRPPGRDMKYHVLRWDYGCTNAYHHVSMAFESDHDRYYGEPKSVFHEVGPMRLSASRHDTCSTDTFEGKPIVPIGGPDPFNALTEYGFFKLRAQGNRCIALDRYDRFFRTSRANVREDLVSLANRAMAGEWG